jgi:MtfA peptidase
MAYILLFLGFIAVFKYFEYHTEKKARFIAMSAACTLPETSPGDIIFTGLHKSLEGADLGAILNRRYPYYHALNDAEKEIFLNRLQIFISNKTFIIRDKEGFKEMPVLVSAAAIQLTFGLDDYLLPFYKYICIYPEEYFADGSLKVLAGNVQGNVISIAWNQFLKGYDDCTDGNNVGLHEMSHALYFQKIEIEGPYAKIFSDHYTNLMAACREAHHMETRGIKDLYSDYASVNVQEFWAESIELFFEKPDELKRTYPSLFMDIVSLLKQDPRNHSAPRIIEIKSPVKKITDFLLR